MTDAGAADDHWAVAGDNHSAVTDDGQSAVAEHFRSAVASAGVVVVKVGTRVLAGSGGSGSSAGRIDPNRIEALAAGLCRIADTGRQTLLVSSGAVAAGLAKLAITRPTGLAQLQSVAAVGQADLIGMYEAAFIRRNRHAAQVLLTARDLRRREAYLNVRNTLGQIHSLGAIAVINENDSVAVAELMTTFGDNDSLAAAVATMYGDSMLVILSDVDGLFDGPPDHAESRKLDLVETIDDSIERLAMPHDDASSKGGMASKISAARIVTAAGIPAVVAPGRRDGVLESIIDGRPIGTLFVPKRTGRGGRRRWIGSTTKVSGSLCIDDGAARAIIDQHRSLLAVGITQVRGEFGAGDVVALVDSNGQTIARGLSNYPSDEIQRIAGQRNEAFGEILGHRTHESIVHRDNMAIV